MKKQLNETYKNVQINWRRTPNAIVLLRTDKEM